MKKQLGGNRLGSGNKLSVNLKGYERSTHDLGYIWRSSMAAGTLVPFMNEVGLPGDTFDIDLNVDVKTLPTVGPLFGSYKVQLDVFTCPIRLYEKQLHNNKLKIGNHMEDVVLPVIDIEVNPVLSYVYEDVDNCQVNPSCILSYLGIRGYGMPQGSIVKREFNAVPLLGYWDIYKNYYANKQEGLGAVIHIDRGTIVQDVESITIDNNIAAYTLEQFPNESANISYTYNSTLTITHGGAFKPEWISIYIDGLGWTNLESLAVNGIIYIIDSTHTEIKLKSGLGWIKSWDYQSDFATNTDKPTVVDFDLENIDRMREYILTTNAQPYKINDSGLPPYSYIWSKPNGIYNTLGTQEGLGLKTYQSDLFNNWLETTWINEISTSSAVSTVSGSFTIDQLILSKKVYEMLNRIAVSGGSYEDWIESVYDVKSYNKTETPVYHGGLIKELVFQEVVSNTQTEDQPLGTLAGKGTMAKKHKGGKVRIKLDEHCYVMGIVSITPRIDYSQGNRWDVNLKTMNDFHKPALDEIGFQDLITEQQAWWTTEHTGTEWEQKSAGKQPAWLNYMTNYNRCYGNFAIKSDSMFMTLNRRYETTVGGREIIDLTTYIDPSKFNFVFADTSLDAQNFWVQIGTDITARRKMSARLMPNL